MHVLDKRLLLLRVQPYTSHEKERQRWPNRKRHSSSNPDYDTCKAMWYSKHGKVKACRPKQVVPNCRMWDCCHLLKQTSQRDIQHKTKFCKKNLLKSAREYTGIKFEIELFVHELSDEKNHESEQYMRGWTRTVHCFIRQDALQRQKTTKNRGQKGPKLQKHRHRCKGWWKW